MIKMIAFACTYTDEELKLMMGPRLADYITCFEGLFSFSDNFSFRRFREFTELLMRIEPYSTTIPRLWKTGALFDAVQWARKVCIRLEIDSPLTPCVTVNTILKMFQMSSNLIVDILHPRLDDVQGSV